MQIIVQGHGMEITAPIRDYSHKKISKLAEFFKNIQKVEVTLDHRKIDDLTRNNVAEVSMWVAGKKVIRATEGSQDIYSAIDLVFAKLEQQLRKHKEKHVQEKRREARKVKEEMEEIHYPKEKGPVLVKVKRFASKPMSLEEAKEELKISDQDFIMFREAGSGSINLIYKKGDKEFEVLSQDKGEVKNLDPQKAMEEIMKEGKDFYMFLNPETENLNVIYRRKSGNYGLIVPEF